jgi:hypothetical protein
MRVNWMAGGPQKACADFNLRTHSISHFLVKKWPKLWTLATHNSTKYSIKKSIAILIFFSFNKNWFEKEV